MESTKKIPEGQIADFISASAKAALLTKEDKVNKSTDQTLSSNSDTKYPTEKAVKSYIDAKDQLLKSEIDNEVIRATTAEVSLATNLTAETTRAILSEETLATNVANEIVRATNVEGTKEDKVNKNIPGGYAGLGLDGKLISSQLPSITIHGTFVVASQVEMLSIICETGDVAIRTDLNRSFILRGSNSTVLGDWQELLTPTDSVSSVFGRNGSVVAQTGDYSADQITETVVRRFQTASQFLFNDAASSIQSQLDNRELIFSKLTAFNKNFGTTAGTVAEGNDQRILNGQTAFGWGNHAGLYQPISGEGGSYIQNQNASAQSANMWISGSGTFGSNVTATMFYAGASLRLNSDASDGHITGRAGKGLKFFTNDGSSNPLSLSTSGVATFSSSINIATNIYSPFLSNTIGSGVYRGNSFVIRNGALGSESLNFDIFNRSTNVWYNPLSIANTGATTFASSVTVGGDISMPFGSSFRSVGFAYNTLFTSSYEEGSGDYLDFFTAGNGVSNAPRKLRLSASGAAFSSSITATRVNGTDTSNWIGGNFGSTAGSDRVVIGNLGGQATIGAHNSSLNAWSTLYIQGSGQQTIFGGAGTFASSITATNFIGAGTGLTGTALGLSIGGTSSSTPWTGITEKEGWLSRVSLVGDHLDANEWRNSGFYENGGSGSNWPTNYTWYNSINVRHSNQGNYHGFQVAMSFYDNKFWFRSYNGNGTFQGWEHAISSKGGTINGIIDIVGANHKYLYINPGNGYEAMVRYNGGNGSSWYVGKRMTSTPQADTTGFHLYSEANNDTVVGIDTSGNLRTKGDVIAFSSSDRRLKDNIQNIPNPIDKILKIGGYSFDWNSKQSTYTGHDIGVVAQEIESVLPELVTTRGNGYKAVKYDKLVALLIEGMKEQQLQINELRGMIKTK